MLVFWGIWFLWDILYVGILCIYIEILYVGILYIRVLYVGDFESFAIFGQINYLYCG